MIFERSSGILLHPTSLPGPYGIGDIGPEAYRWIDFLASTGCSLWQVLPLGPTGYGDSPYQCFSAFAGNPLLISPELLIAEGLLNTDDVIEDPILPTGNVDFGKVIPYKLGIIDRSYTQYKNQRPAEIQDNFNEFQQIEKYWLEDFAIFMALKEYFGGGPWIDWPQTYRIRDPETLKTFVSQNHDAIERQAYRQFIFFRQWKKLRKHAIRNNIKIIGDIPIFVAHDSADVWSHPELFFLDANGNPTVVSGVPPDYFSRTGQLWGNPIYRWDVHASDKYSWWVKRFQAVLSTVDIVRLDHFRGFAGYWEIPAREETAINGRWIRGPGQDFFNQVKNSLGDLPILAEDLGVITGDVEELRKTFNLPGMKVLVFAFDSDGSNNFLPHHHTRDCVVYTGTHDNDTVSGWFQRVGENERDFTRRYLASNGQDISWDLIRAAWSSVAVFALAPLQDFLGLDNHARMNFPSTLGGNWVWRTPLGALDELLSNRIDELNKIYSRSIYKRENDNLGPMVFRENLT